MGLVAKFALVFDTTQNDQHIMVKYDTTNLLGSQSSTNLANSTLADGTETTCKSLKT
jgi:hypothetical protein